MTTRQRIHSAVSLENIIFRQEGFSISIICWQSNTCLSPDEHRTFLQGFEECVGQDAETAALERVGGGGKGRWGQPWGGMLCVYGRTDTGCEPPFPSVALSCFSPTLGGMKQNSFILDLLPATLFLSSPWILTEFSLFFRLYSHNAREKRADPSNGSALFTEAHTLRTCRHVHQMRHRCILCRPAVSHMSYLRRELRNGQIAESLKRPSAAQQFHGSQSCHKVDIL